MNKKFKRICAGILTLVVLGSATTAFAEWRQAGYDLDGNFEIQYQEFDAKGLWTGRMVKGAEAEAIGLKGFPTTIEYKDSYPNSVYYCTGGNAGTIHDANTPAHFCGHEALTGLYLDGNKVVANWGTGLKAGVEEKWENLYFELAAPHKIVQKKYTNLPGIGWTTSANHPLRYSGINEIVSVKAEQVYVDIEDVLGSAKDVVCVEDAWKDVFKNTKKLYQKRLVGTIVPVEVVDTTVGAYGLYSAEPCAKVEWIYAGYEGVYPYRCFEVLSIDGYVMDGSTIVIKGDDVTPLDDVVVKKPYIYRYNGAFAHPNAQ